MQIISVVIHFLDSARPIFAVPFHALQVDIYLFTARNAVTIPAPRAYNPRRYYRSAFIMPRGGLRRNLLTYFFEAQRSILAIRHQQQRNSTMSSIS